MSRKWKKKEIRSGRRIITQALKEGWVEIGEYGIQLTPLGIKMRDKSIRAMMDTLFEMAVTV